MLEGKCYLIKRNDHKWKFYWAPYEPAPKKDLDDWGVAVIDTSWKTEDPRPKHLRGKPLDYQLQPWIQVLRDPNVYSEKYDMYGKDWRGYSLTYEVMRCLIIQTRIVVACYQLEYVKWLFRIAGQNKNVVFSIKKI